MLIIYIYIYIQQNLSIRPPPHIDDSLIYDRFIWVPNDCSYNEYYCNDILTPQSDHVPKLGSMVGRFREVLLYLFIAIHTHICIHMWCIYVYNLCIYVYISGVYMCICNVYISIYIYMNDSPHTTDILLDVQLTPVIKVDISISIYCNGLTLKK